MALFKKRNLLVPLAAVLLTGLVCCLVYTIPLLGKTVQHQELLILSIIVMMTLTVMLFWISLGPFGGLASLLVSMIFIYRPLTDMTPYYYNILVLAFFLNCFLGHNLYRRINRSNQEYKVMMEKIQEDINLIQDHFETRGAEIQAMEEKIDSLLKLKNIADILSLSLSTEEVIKVVVEKAADKFKGDVRVLFYLVDEVTGALSLSHAQKAETRSAPVMKKGGVFERWVLKNMQSLLVKNVGKDFRFSSEGESDDEDFNSLISVPLVNEGNVVGIIRVDARDEEFFGQHELRILDIIGELASIALENSTLYRRTEELAIRDSLTGLYVHRHFMERLEAEIKRGLHSSISFALIMLDIDNFKDFNDKYGHMTGDILLKKVANVLIKKASAGDIVCRYGGEEFAFVALNCKKQDAIKLAEEIRKEVENNFIMIRREKKSVTVSIGIAMFPDEGKLKDDLIWEADRFLYQAKSQGKNRVCVK
jgi:diguanylate cyclase (GGDEF)-like protein